MRTLQFTEQRLSNFKAFLAEQILRWDASDVTLVVGENRIQPTLGQNGAGKSTLYDSLCWCLYGRTPSGLRNPDITPWVKAKTPTVALEVLIDDKPHIIKRTANPNRLTVNDKDITQNDLDALLGINYALFTNTVLLAQGQPLFFDRRPAEKMELFSETLQLDRWDARSAAATAATTLAERELIEAIGEAKGLESALQELRALLKEVKVKAEAWASEARLKARQAHEQLVGLQLELDKKGQPLAAAIVKEDELGLRLRFQRADETRLQKEAYQIKSKIGEIEAKTHFIQRRMVEIERELAILVKTKICPTCGQAVKPANLSKHKTHLERERDDLHLSLDALKAVELSSKLEALEEQLEAAARQVEELDIAFQSEQSSVRRWQLEVSALEEQLKILQKACDEEAANPYTDQIRQMTAREKQLLNVMKNLAQKQQTITRKLECNKFWIKGFKDIKLQLIDDVLSELNLVTNGMLEAVGLIDWQVQYDVERETKSGTVQRTLNVQIQSPQSHGLVRWECWSGGEQQRLRLIGALALADVLLAYAGVQPNLEILDEPAVYFSSDGVSEICRFLAERARDKHKSIYYTEHQAVDSVHFSQSLLVIKDQGGAHIDG